MLLYLVCMQGRYKGPLSFIVCMVLVEYRRSNGYTPKLCLKQNYYFEYLSKTTLQALI